MSDPHKGVPDETAYNRANRGEDSDSASSRRDSSQNLAPSGPKSLLSPYYGARSYSYAGYGTSGYRGQYGGNTYGGGISLGGFSVSRLLRRKWLMLAVFVLVSGAAVPWIWILHQPSYQSTAQIRVAPYVSYLVFRTENNGFLPLYTSYLNTQIAIMRSPRILERVLDKSKVRETSWYKGEGRRLFGEEGSALNKLKQATSVLARRGTELIDITVTAGKPDDARTLVDAIVDEYKLYVDEAQKENEGWLLETLNRERATLEKEIAGLQATKYNIARRLGTQDPASIREQLVSYLNLLDAEKRRLARQKGLIMWELDRMSAVPTQPAAEGDDASPALSGSNELTRRYSDDSQWRELNGNVEQLKQTRELDLQSYGEEHPRMKRIDKSIELAERSLHEREEELDQEWNGTSGHALRPGSPKDRPRILQEQAQRIQQEIELVDQEIDRQRAQVSDIGDMALEIATYEEQISNKQSLVNMVRQRQQALDLESKSTLARVDIASHGVVPTGPASDRRGTLTMMTFAAALMVALAVGYLRSSVDKRIYDAGEVQQVYRAPFLGLVPELPSVKVPRELGGTLPVASGRTSSHGSYSYSYNRADSCQSLMESVRMVRTALLERVIEKDQRVVLITSAVPRTGKTSVGVLLARSLAMLNKRVLLVEADLRHPTLASRLNIEAKLGLASILTGAARDDQAIVHTDVSNLNVLVAGEIPDNFNTESLANGVCAACLERWKEEYDFVILDSPPILPVADARILASYADGTIMVLRSSHDLRTEAMEAYAQLSAAGGKLVGTVLIGGSMGKSRPSSYGYLQFPVSSRWRNRYGGYPGHYPSQQVFPTPPATSDSSQEKSGPDTNRKA